MEEVREENSVVISAEVSTVSDETNPVPSSVVSALTGHKTSADIGDVPESRLMDAKETAWESSQVNKNTDTAVSSISPNEKLETESITPPQAQNAKVLQSRDVRSIVEDNGVSVANLKTMECNEQALADQTGDGNGEDSSQYNPSEDSGTVFSMVQIGENMKADTDTDATSSSDSEDDSSDSSDDDSSSDDSCDIAIRRKEIDLAEEIATLKDAEPLKVKGEILPNELPPVEELDIALPDDVVLEPVGKITHIMDDYSVIIHSYSGRPALDIDTILFLSRQLAMGKVAETFGPVPNPFYVVRFNSQDHLDNKCVELDKEVFYAPRIQDFTSYVFVSELRKLKGSDASWCNDTEPPTSCLDYSDDEQEREARRKPKNEAANGENGQHIRNGGTKRPRPGHQNNHRGRGRGRGRWQNEVSRHIAPGPDPSQMGWQTAISNVPRHGYPCMPPPPCPDLMTCFQRPPPTDMPGCSYRSLGFPPNLSHIPNLTTFSQRSSAARWDRSSLSHFQPPACDFGLPPPPPPPP